jgi:hypothetical protein
MADNDLKIARRRIRHLAPWNVRPVPMMHSVRHKPTDQTSDQPDRTKQVALKVLALHMSQAAAKGDLH